MNHITFNLSGVLCIVAVRIELAIILPFQPLTFIRFEYSTSARD